MARVGDVNHLVAIVGKRGTGKSTETVRRTLHLGRRYGAYMIGHSPGARLPETLPDGSSSDIVWHDSLAQLDAGLREDPTLFHVVVDPSVSPDAVVDYGRKLAERCRRAADPHYRPNRPQKGVDCPPVLIAIDEGIAIEGELDKLHASKGNDGRRRPRKAGALDREWEVFLTGLRHEHVILLWSIQNASARSWFLIDAATELVVFRVRHEWQFNALRASGVPQRDLDTIRNLPRFRHIEYNDED